MTRRKTACLIEHTLYVVNGCWVATGLFQSNHPMPRTAADTILDMRYPLH